MTIVLMSAAPAYSENKFKLKLGAKGQVCLKCHETFKKTLNNRFVHPLLKKGECTGCHVPHTSAHKKLLAADTTMLCSECHQKILPDNAQSAHSVVVAGNCMKCHDSHGSNNKFILKDSGNSLCYSCHKDMSDNLSNVRFRHKSIDRGNGCLNCHNPHASAKSNFLLERDVPSLCRKCHESEKLTFRRTHMSYPVADANCISCHDPHGSNNRGIVFDVAHAGVTERKCTECHQRSPSLKTKRQATDLCRECHKKTVDQALDKNRVHWPLLDKVGCLNCHGPHASKEKKLLQGPVRSVCGKCHADTVELQKWSIDNPKNEDLCEPVKQGECTICHSPHAADKALLITQESISLDLCGRCHKWEAHSSHPIGEKVVDQRNKNLTVSCLSCHKACGTGNNPDMLTFGTTYELCIQCHVERIK